MTKLCIALDAMGGDHGPSVIIPAAITALGFHSQLKLFLVGNKEILEEHLKQHRHLNHPRLDVIASTQVVEMDESPASALRKKTHSSMRIAIDLVKDGRAAACVSAGNTGALMAISRFVLKMLPGVDRPAIVYSLPTMTGHVHVLDLGANVDCEPKELYQFAIMGSILATAVDNLPNPKVALLNIGSEAIKGSVQVKKAAELLTQTSTDINYIGYVEGDDIYKGTADVVVCDGFVGNVALKVSEGIAKLFIQIIKDGFLANPYSKVIGLLASPIFRRIMRKLDPNNYNGASFLGLRGIVIKSHGSAESKAFAQAIQVALKEIEKNVPEKIQHHLKIQLEGPASI